MSTKVFYGWYIAGACLLIILYTGGVVYFGFTAIFEPIVKEFGWSYAQVSFAASLRGLEMSLLAPIMGIIVDHWGPKRLIFSGSIFCCMGFLLLSRTESLAMFYAAFALMAIGMSMCNTTVLMTAVTNWFHKKAAVAIGIVASGVGLGGLIVPVVTVLIDVLQWRTAMVVVGLGMLAIVLPLSLIVRHKPEQYGYQPDGITSSVIEIKDSELSQINVEVNVMAKQAIKTRAFWYLAITTMCHAFVVGAIVTHMMPYLGSLDISRTTSSLVALALPVVSIGGRLGSSWFTMRWGTRKVLAAGFVFMTTGLIIFGYISSIGSWLLIPFIIMFSFGWGCNVTTRLALQREYFGRSHFGTILGFIQGLMMLGNVTGAPFAGWVFDTWGTYQGAWFASGALTIIAVILVITIPSSGGTT